MRKQASWRAAFEKAMGGHTHLDIKNFATFQPAMDKKGSRRYVVSDVETAFHEEDLGFFLRGLLRDLRHWRGREDAPVKADMPTIMSATNAYPQDRKFVPRAILQLIELKYLIPVTPDKAQVRRESGMSRAQEGHKKGIRQKQVSGNEPHSLEKRREERRREEEGRQPENTKTEKAETDTQESAPVETVKGYCQKCKMWDGHRSWCPRKDEKPAPVKVFKPTLLSAWDEDVKDAEGLIPAEYIRRALAYKRKSGNDFWEKRGPAHIREHARELVNEAPESALRPTFEARPDPDCPECKGRGEIIIEDGLYQSSETCACVKQVEIQ